MKDKIVTLLGDAGHSHDILLEHLENRIKSGFSDYVLKDTQPELLESFLSSGPALFILSKMNPHKQADGTEIDWMNESREQRILAFVKSGGSLLVWHSGLATYPKDGAFIKMLGGHFFHRPPDPMKVKYSPVPDTPMTPDFGDFEVTDEHYQTVCDIERTKVFLNSSSDEGQSPAGWYTSYGDGRICCLAAPHLSGKSKIPQLESILDLCMRWCLKETA